MKEHIVIEERSGTPIETVRLAHQHIVTGLTMAGYRVSSSEGSTYSGETRSNTISIRVEYEYIRKDRYGNEIE